MTQENDLTVIFSRINHFDYRSSVPDRFAYRSAIPDWWESGAIGIFSFHKAVDDAVSNFGYSYLDACDNVTIRLHLQEQKDSVAQSLKVNLSKAMDRFVTCKIG